MTSYFFEMKYPAEEGPFYENILEVYTFAQKQFLHKATFFHDKSFNSLPNKFYQSDDSCY